MIRYRAYAEDMLPSGSATQSYLFGVDRGDSGCVYVVSLVGEPKDLTSKKTGILYNWNEDYGIKHIGSDASEEKEGHVEVYNGSGQQVIGVGCGIQLHGQSTRTLAQKGLRVIARARYGSKSFDYPLFTERTYTSYDSFLLRASGNDWKRTHMKDAVLQQLARDTSLVYQERELCLLYINGTYWGLYYLRERTNNDAICRAEGWEGAEDLLDVVKAERYTAQGSNASYKELREWIKANDPKSADFYAHISQYVDLKNYFEYVAIQVFIGNWDAWNIKRYRNADADGKWRWVLYDLDWGFGKDVNSIEAWLDPDGLAYNVDNTLFIACMKNPQARDEFLTYFGEKLTTEFTTEHMEALFTEQYRLNDPLMDAQLERWGLRRKDFEADMKEVMEYCRTRPAKIISYFRRSKRLGLTDEEYHRYFDAALSLIAEAAA